MAQGGELITWYSTQWILTNFEWFIVACMRGQIWECCHFCIIWMMSLGGFSSSPWILIADRIWFEILACFHFGALAQPRFWRLCEPQRGYCTDQNSSPLRKRLSHSLKSPVTHLQKPPQRFGDADENTKTANYEVFEWVGTSQSRSAQLDAELKHYVSI